MNMQWIGQVPEGDIYQVVLENRRGLEARLLSLGASLTSLQVPDKDGNLRDVVLGLEKPEDYLDNPAYFGAALGRYTGRIRDARFEWEGQSYQLDANDGPNQLHGGTFGFSRRLWMPVVLSQREVLFRLISPDGDMGFPGQVEAEVGYALEGNALRIHYRAQTSRPTPLSLSNHAYFNLKGHTTGVVAGHRLMINAESYTAGDETLLPTGEIRPVAGSSLDFREPVYLKDRLQDLDHNFLLKGGEGPQAVLSEEESGLSLEVFTDRPCLQVYAGGYFESVKGKEGAVYGPHHGLALEPQGYPDAMHHPHFPSGIWPPGKLWESETIYRFEGAGVAKGKRAQMIYI